jgi:membrane protein implicated in regulation of membrane protease activity
MKKNKKINIFKVIIIVCTLITFVVLSVWIFGNFILSFKWYIQLILAVILGVLGLILFDWVLYKITETFDALDKEELELKGGKNV